MLCLLLLILTVAGSEDIIVDEKTTRAVASAMVSELKNYAKECRDFEKKDRFNFGSLSPEAVALHAIQADIMDRTSRTEKSKCWETNLPDGWEILKAANLTPLSVFSYFITTFLKSFVKKSNECLPIFVVLSGLTSMVVSALYCLPGQIRLGEAMLNFGIKERCMVTNDAGLTATSERTTAFQKAEAKKKQLPVNPDYLKYMNIKPLKEQIADLEVEISNYREAHAADAIDTSECVYKIEILAAQIDNLNRLLAKEIGGNKIMQDLISGLLLVITIPVSEVDILEIKARGCCLFRPGILEKACKSFGLPADDPESFESKCNELDFTRIEKLYSEYINVALRNALDSMIAGAQAFEAAKAQGVDDEILLEEARWTAIEAYSESTRTSMIEDILQSDADDISSRYKASIRLKFMKLAYGKTSTVAALLDYTLHFLKATKRWWEDGNQIIIMGDQQVWKLLIDMQQSLIGLHPELGHMLIFDGEWHKTAQGNLSAVAFLTAEAMGTSIMETRQKESTQVAADSWQEGDAAAEAGRDVLTREAFGFYVKKIFKDDMENEVSTNIVLSFFGQFFDIFCQFLPIFQ